MENPPQKRCLARKTPPTQDIVPESGMLLRFRIWSTYFLMNFTIQSSLQFVQNIFEDIVIAHQLQSGIGVCQFAASPGRIIKVESSLHIYLKFLGQHHDNVALLSPQYRISHTSSSFPCKMILPVNVR